VIAGLLDDGTARAEGLKVQANGILRDAGRE
jgi:hypothetical protein